MKVKARKGWLQKTYWAIVKSENILSHFFLLIVRLYWGTLLVITGLGKWIHIHSVADYFNTLHLPVPLVSAATVATIEILGGISLILGLCSRLFSIVLTLMLMIAYVFAHQEALSQIFTKPSLFVEQEPFLYLFASLIVLCFGPGLFSFDFFIEKRNFGSAL